MGEMEMNGEKFKKIGEILTEMDEKNMFGDWYFCGINDDISDIDYDGIGEKITGIKMWYNGIRIDTETDNIVTLCEHMGVYGYSYCFVNQNVPELSTVEINIDTGKCMYVNYDENGENGYIDFCDIENVPHFLNGLEIVKYLIDVAR